MEEIKENICSICGKPNEPWPGGPPIYGYGNNAWPINSGRCCNTCNDKKVIPARIAMLCNIVNKKNQ